MKWMDGVSERWWKNERLAEWKEKENATKEGGGVYEWERELILYEWNQLTSPTWPGVEYLHIQLLQWPPVASSWVQIPDTAITQKCTL